MTKVKTYHDKRLHIFDYDYTLYLDYHMPYENQYRYKQYVINKIKGLKEEGKLIAMASHNASAKWYIYDLYREIYNCFDMFICQYPRNKDTMVSEILERLNCKPEEAIFYDDVKSNTDLVELLGVTSYLVDDKRGIVFEEIQIVDEVKEVKKVEIKKIVEGALMAAGKSLDITQIERLFTDDERPPRDQIKAALEEIDADSRGRGFELKQTASGYRFQVHQELATWVNRLWEEKPKRYSRAMLETLSLIAYRQPLTRGDIEVVRGVAVSSEIIKTLQEREWIRVVGYRDVPGKPALFATTKQFLDYFNLKSLDDLPALGEIKDLTELDPALELSLAQGVASNDDGEETLVVGMPESIEIKPETVQVEPKDDSQTHE